MEEDLKWSGDVFIVEKMDKWGYLNMYIKRQRKAQCRKMGLLNNFKFYAHNDPKHAATNHQTSVLLNMRRMN